MNEVNKLQFHNVGSRKKSDSQNTRIKHENIVFYPLRASKES